MIIRIVKMHFQPDKVNDFVDVFNDNKSRIAGFEGCMHVELLKDINSDNTFFTYSHWTSPNALEVYRHSNTFRDIWGKTKVLFNRAPEAWSVQKT